MKHIAKKYFKHFVGLSIFLGGIIATYFVRATSMDLRFDDQLATTFGSDIFTYRSNVDFIYGGNEKVGMYLPRDLEILAVPEEVALNGGSTGLCYAQVKGVYYNNERGERNRPLDLDTLSGLQAIDATYDDVSLSGGLFTHCNGFSGDRGDVYGQLTTTYQSSTYYLMAGTTYNFPANVHGTSLSGSLQRANNMLCGYLWDSYGGIGAALGASGCVIQKVVSVEYLSGSQILSGTIQIRGSHGTGLVFSTTGTIHIISPLVPRDVITIPLSGFSISTVSGTWDGVIFPPISLLSGDGKNARFGENGIPAQREGSITRTILSTVKAGAESDSLIAHGGYFSLSFVVAGGTQGDVLKIFRSENGSTWTANTPDATCTLDSNLVCSFRTDHLSYFATVQDAGSSSGDNGGNIRLVKDSCLSSPTKPNLSGANKDGIDYSPSHYDGICAGPQSHIVQQNTDANTGADISISCTLYSDELNGAYTFARSFDVTTINQCRDVGIYGKLIRKDLAKMIVNFSKNVFSRTGIVVDDPGCSLFTDISHETDETQHYIQQACEYGLMGLTSDGVTPQSKFKPYENVSRAQFGTILSRFIRGSDNNAVGNELYYTKHLQVLKTAGIMTQISNPAMKELRGRVMLTMQRIYEKE